MDDQPGSLDRAALQANYFFGLQPKPGTAVPLRVSARNLFRYIYDPLSSTYNPFGANNVNLNAPIPPGTFVSPFLLSSQTLNSVDVFQPLLAYTIYQLFFSWTPTRVRMYKTVPNQERIGTLENISTNVWSPSNPEFGFYVNSYIGAPLGSTEVILPPKVEFAPAFYNPLPYPVSPLIEVWVNKLVVEVVTDPKTAQAILRGAFGTLKSISQDLTADGVDTNGLYGVKPIKLNADIATITAALANADTLRAD